MGMSPVWENRDYCRGGTTGFFYLSMCHSNLEAYYHMQFALAQHHNWSLTELDSLIPFEREIYINMLMDYIQKENERKEREGMK